MTSQLLARAERQSAKDQARRYPRVSREAGKLAAAVGVLLEATEVDRDMPLDQIWDLIENRIGHPAVVIQGVRGARPEHPAAALVTGVPALAELDHDTCGQPAVSSSVALRPAVAMRRRKSASISSSASPYSAQIWSMEAFIPE
jgi:hypothetical protein